MLLGSFILFYLFFFNLLLLGAEGYLSFVPFFFSLMEKQTPGFPFVAGIADCDTSPVPSVILGTLNSSSELPNTWDFFLSSSGALERD